LPEQDGSLTISVIGTLPPLKGISPYCTDYALSLAKEAEVDFINFKKLYPERLYPGGTTCDDSYPANLSEPHLKVRNVLTWYNPLSWIWAGLSLKGDVVHAQWWTGILAPMYYTILAIAKLRGKKVIITVHNAEPHENQFVYRLFNRSIFHLGDEFIVHNSSNKREMLKLLKSGRKTVHVIPHIPFSSVRTRCNHAEMDKLRGELGVTDAGKMVIFFGNIREYKGLDVLLRAVPKVKDSYPDATFMIVGQPWEDWAKYAKIIADQGIGKSIRTKLRYLPFNDLRKYILASDLAVFPFKKLDSASGSVVLARSLGKPVVVSEVEGLSEVRGNDVFLAKPGCPDSLADMIKEALSHGENDGNQLREPPGNNLPDSEIVISQHLRVYRRLKSAGKSRMTGRRP
jgi:glycosyltransferase involved in cell wall biosynthesis